MTAEANPYLVQHGFDATHGPDEVGVRASPELQRQDSFLIDDPRQVLWVADWHVHAHSVQSRGYAGSRVDQAPTAHRQLGKPRPYDHCRIVSLPDRCET